MNIYLKYYLSRMKIKKMEKDSKKRHSEKFQQSERTVKK